MSRKRLQLDLSSQARERLRRCREKSDAHTNAEVVRRALHVYGQILDHTRGNANLQRVEENGDITEIELIV